MAKTIATLANTSNSLALETNGENASVLPSIIHVLISDEAVNIFQWIFYAVLLMAVDSFGIVTNIINIICFIKDCVKDPVNISLLGLAVSDLGSLITLIWTNICLTPAFKESDLPFDSIEFQYLTAGWPHVVFARITSCITALIALERCLCITMPLKVKRIVTPKRITIAIISIFIILIGSITPMYYANRLGMKFSPERNRTILGLVFTEDREIVESYSMAINNLLVPFGAFLTVIICTITLVVKLRKKTKWRLKSTAPKKVEAMSDRDQKVAKMVVVISTLFIVCFIPFCFIVMAMMLDTRISVNGQYKNTLYVLAAVGFLLESVNSSMNIFIYYHMSSKYRTVFKQLFRFKFKATSYESSTGAKG